MSHTITSTNFVMGLIENVWPYSLNPWDSHLVLHRLTSWWPTRSSAFYVAQYCKHKFRNVFDRKSPIIDGDAIDKHSVSPIIDYFGTHHKDLRGLVIVCCYRELYLNCTWEPTSSYLPHPCHMRVQLPLVERVPVSVTYPSETQIISPWTFSKYSALTGDLFGSHWYPSCVFLVISRLGFQARVGNLKIYTRYTIEEVYLFTLLVLLCTGLTRFIWTRLIQISDLLMTSSKIKG